MDLQAKNAEVVTKLARMRAVMAVHNLEAVCLRGVDWFSWATAGGTSVVIMTSEVGIAEVLVGREQAWVLTNKIEQARLANEEVPPVYEILGFPWQEPEAPDNFAHAQFKGRIASDRPQLVRGEIELPSAFKTLKLQLEPQEIARYRDLGRTACIAMSKALNLAKPDWSEQRLAGEGAKALWSQGLEPTLVLVGGEERVMKYRHAVAKDAPLGDFAMMVFCARAYGLYANLTRFIYFRPPTTEEKQRYAVVKEVEAAALAASRIGQKISSVYTSIAQAYAQAGCGNEIDRHHQGGPTGYLSREAVAGPPPRSGATLSDSDVVLQDRMALAWNPSLPGAKIEDTFLLTHSGLECLTLDPEVWPTVEVQGRLRPDLMIMK
jgi:Xaa-Pro aminopeptidase